MTDAILAEGLVKRYKEVTALDGIDLRVPEGSVLAPARPQRRRQDHRGEDPDHADHGRRGAGRGGRASTSPATRARCARKIGLSGQYAAVDEYLTGFENLEMVGRLYHLGRRESAAAGRASCSTDFRLERRRRPPVKTYSGGMRRRLDLAGALVARRRCCSSTSRPPASTRAAAPRCGTIIQELVAGGTTLLLTTQYLEEADLLADNIVVIDHGKVIAEGTADDAQVARSAASGSRSPWPTSARSRPRSGC